MLDALNDLDGSLISDTVVIEYLLEVSAKTTDSSIRERLKSLFLSKLKFDSWRLIIQFYAAFYSGSLSGESSLISNSFSTLNPRVLFAEMKCFNCSWSVFASLFKELIFTSKFPLNLLILLGQFYAKQQQTEALEQLVTAINSSSSNVIYRALILMTELESVTVSEAIKIALKKVLSLRGLSSLISVNQDEFDFDLPFDDFDEAQDGFNGAEFSQFITNRPSRRVVIISPCTDMVLVAQAVAFVVKHFDDAKDVSHLLSRKEYKDLRAFLSLLSINI